MSILFKICLVSQLFFILFFLFLCYNFILSKVTKFFCF
nr:hypothetical protein RU987_pgp026 [Laurencia catarinensis]WMP12554.1 hypothetical protein [Laurencia catarinensis]